MRNVILSDFKSLHLKSLVGCEAFCHNGHVIYACDKGKIIKSQANSLEVICTFTENLYPSAENTDIPRVLEIIYCYEKNCLYLILINGDIISVQVDEIGSDNIVGSVDGGIKAAKWSPNKEVIALVTGNDSVIVMTQDFDVVSEVDLHGGGFGERQFITVGWGTKETQFRGSEGKFNSNVKKKYELDVLTENVDAIKISWKGDAEYFAVSCINPDTCKRYLRIFSKNGILQYTSEDVNGLEHTLDWSSTGSLIASTQVLPNKYIVCFFEKNGLQHGGFQLPLSFQDIKVEDLLWNKDSKILALLITRISDKNTVNKTKCILLYTVSNYNWYCKYTINFDFLTVPLFIQWDDQKCNSLNVIVEREKKIYFYKYSWLWVINKSKGNSLNDESLVAVIDGCNLKVTAFNKGVIPPPMCTHKIELPITINSVCFAPDIQDVISSNDLLVHLSNGDILIFKFVDNGFKGINYEFVGEIKKFYNELEIWFNAHWVEKNIFMICFVKIEEDESKPFLTVLNIENFKRQYIAFEKQDFPLSSTIALLKASKSSVLFHTNNKKLYSYNKTNSELLMLCENKNTLVDLEIKDKQNGGFNFFSLDSLNKFYVNNNVLLNNVLSFHFHENSILLTTMKHELVCLNAETEITNTDLSEVCLRRVERGSRIITSVHKDSKVILQMPRGNLECIQPRALMLIVLGKYLDSLNYFCAFDLMRKQRINLNLLYDHNPVLFSKNVNLFLKQILDLHWISLFLSELSDEDVTQTMYSVIYKNRTNKVDSPSNKIDAVCTLIEKALEQKENSEKYLLPLLMCYIKRGKTKYLENALLKLKELKEKEQKGIKLPVTFDEALKYVLYLIDVDELYKVALGMYDFDLVIIIAGKSQKDPKEYLEFLNKLNKLEANYQKYKIDKYLKRYKKALSSLVMCEGDDVFNECIIFIKTHQLYKYALKLIPENTDRYKNICICYADELMSNQSYEEAGLMYSNAGNYKNALEAYRKAGNWQEVLFCGKELKLDESELKELYLDLAMELRETKNYKESATVYLDYLKNVDECVKTLSKGKHFDEAYRISRLYQPNDLINEIILPEITEQGNFMQLHIATMSETFMKQKNRLQIVRKQKMEALEDKNEFDDLYSETNTVITQSVTASRTTNRTYRSAKNRRKQERKLLSLKEGSPYEHLALVISLHNMVTDCIALRSEVKELNKFLLKINQYETAKKLQKGLEDLLNIIEKSKSEIWTSNLLNNRQFYGPKSTSNEISAMYLRSENVNPVSLSPKYSIPPDMQNNLKWKFEILDPTN